MCTINYSYQFIFLGGLGIIGLGIIYGTKQTNSFSMNMCILVFSASEMLINTTIKLNMEEKNLNIKWYITIIFFKIEHSVLGEHVKMYKELII